MAMDVRMRVSVPVHTFGEPQGVKLQGGIFEMVTREVEIECLPSEIPGEIRVDITELMIGKQLRAGDLPLDPRKDEAGDRSAARASRTWWRCASKKRSRRSGGRRSRSAGRARSHQEGQEGSGRGRRRAPTEAKPEKAEK